MSTRLASDELRQAYLADADCPCPACGYNLRSVTAPECPECGATLELVIRDQLAPKGVWWFALIWSVALLLGAGLDGVTGVFRCVNWHGLAMPTHHEAWMHWGVAFGELLLAVAGLVGLVVLFRTPRRAGPAVVRLMCLSMTGFALLWVGHAAYWCVRWWTG